MQDLFRKMQRNGTTSCHYIFVRTIVLFACLSCGAKNSASDYILTIGGGYEPAGNQASLEANVLFFQKIVRERFRETADHQIFFADGLDPAEDLQVIEAKKGTDTPTLVLLESAFALDRQNLSYRNHQVPNIRGPILPKSIKSGLDEVAERLMPGDRLIIYVTAHGSAAMGKDPMNTSITCWRKESLSMKKFSEWLDRLPSNIPVVMVMAQCYCGGFANSMFAGGEAVNGLSKAVRTGFFAQRFDLPAAGCRPDIENDEEYSSYFWGAFLGQTRTGKVAVGVDCDNDGRVALDEAHAYAVRASQTIDIPLRSSDMFLRYYSRIAGYESTRMKGGPSEIEESVEALGLGYFPGQLQEISRLGSKSQSATIEFLAQQLGLALDCEVAEVFRQNIAQTEQFQQSRFIPGRRGPGASGRRGPRSSSRREFQRELIESWPDLEKPSGWKDLPWLFGKEGESILEEFRQLPSFAAFKKGLDDRLLAREKSSGSEIRDVQFRRLIHTMESIMLAKNLPLVASPEIANRYKEMIDLETSFLTR